MADQPARSQSETIARAYMEAYSAANWDAMAPHMSDDFTLIDRTNPDPSFAPEYRGADATLAMLRAFGRDQGVIELGFEFPIVFESNNVVVFVGFVNTYAAPPGVDYAYRWRAQQVTALTVRDGRVARHEDFADYSSPAITRLPRP
jgi:ketosteroid isomerase-like protein